MAECLEFSNNSTGSSGQAYAVYFDDFISIESCPNNEDHHMILDVSEYQMYVLQSELLADSQVNTFDTEAYDFAYEGILMSWVIGLGIGLILAVVAKLKR
jgi:hypothetical protein